MMKPKDPPANRVKESTEEIRKTLEKIPAVVYVAEPGEFGQWIYVSPQIETLLGYTPREWIAQPGLWMQRIHPNDRQQVLEHEADSYYYGFLFDITKERQAEQKAKENEKRQEETRLELEQHLRAIHKFEAV